MIPLFLLSLSRTVALFAPHLFPCFIEGRSPPPHTSVSHPLWRHFVFTLSVAAHPPSSVSLCSTGALFSNHFYHHPSFGHSSLISFHFLWPLHIFFLLQRDPLSLSHFYKRLGFCITGRQHHSSLVMVMAAGLKEISVSSSQWVWIASSETRILLSLLGFSSLGFSFLVPLILGLADFFLWELFAYDGISGNTPYLYSLDTSNMHVPIVITKNVARHFHISPGRQNLPYLRSTALAHSLQPYF